MTREEEAIKIIEDYEVNGCGYCHQGGNEIPKAFNMAIEALKQAAWTPIKIRPLTEEEKEYYESLGWPNGYLDCTYDCSLPDDGQEILVTTRFGSVELDTFCRDSNDGCYFEFYCDIEDVVAWMPLPKAYQKESEDE